MHQDAKDLFIEQANSIDKSIKVVEFGSRDVNGTIKELFDCSKYLGIDIAPGPGVDLVCDAASWEPDDKYDLALCAEVFEHTRDWSLICLTAFKSLKKGGTFLGSCASTGRLPHSAVDGGTLREGEYYSNVSKNDMHLTLESQGWSEVETFYNQECSDLYFKAIK